MQLTPTFKVTTPPTDEPVRVSDLQSQLNADLVDDGGKYSRVLTAAREMLEATSGVTLMPTVWRLFLDRFPRGCEPNESYDSLTINIMRGPVSAIGSVIYTDAAGATQTLSTSIYQSDIERTPSRLRPKYGQFWPVVQYNTLNAVTVEFTAGFSSVALVPKKAIQAILMLSSYWIENPTMIGTITPDISLAYWALSAAVHSEVFDE